MSLTDPPLPVPDDDDLDAAASAVVDGVATPEEIALVAASPDGPARVEALRAVAVAVGRPVPDQDVPAASRALAAALDAFGADDTRVEAVADAPPAERPAEGGGGGAGARGTVTPLHAPPPGSRPSRSPARLTLVAAAAAVLVGLGALVGMVERRDSVGVKTGRDDSFAAAPLPPATAPPQADQESAAAGAAAAPGRGFPSTTVSRPVLAATTVPPPLLPAAQPPVVDGGDVGGQSDLQALVERAAAALDSTPDPATTGRTALPTDVQACVNAGPTVAGEPVGALRYRAVGTFQATPAVVLAYDRPGTPARLLLVLSRAGCTRLASTPF